MNVNLIEDNSLKATEDGYRLGARFNWYRSLPLSCVEKVELSLDGKPVPADAISFGINGHNYRLQDLPARPDEFWFVLDSAVLSVRDPGRVKAGESHRLELQLAMRAPYILVGPGKFMVQTWHYSTTQVAE
jgi:hypothetical protein